MSKLKIFIANHKENNYIPECDFIQPVQVGSAFSKKQFDGMDKDNTGINISEKNPMYCELTAQYWAWKNIDVEYYGFFHYRRYLLRTIDGTAAIWTAERIGDIAGDPEAARGQFGKNGAGTDGRKL